jgi:hypothetical protein
MKLQFNRVQLYLIGSGIILFYVFLNRIINIVESDFANGKVMKENEWKTHADPDNEAPPLIEFTRDTLAIIFRADANFKYAPDEIVKVIYNKKDIYDAHVYSFVGFWLSPFLYALLPLIILTAFLFSFFNESSVVVFKIPFFKNKNPQPEDKRIDKI